MTGNSNYPERIEPLPVGTIVLHDCDAKEPRCLSVVTKLRPDGWIESRYIHPDKEDRSKRWVNPPRSLLDPAPFGIEVSLIDGFVVVHTNPDKITARYKDGAPASGPRRVWSEAFELASGRRVPVPETEPDQASEFTSR